MTEKRKDNDIDHSQMNSAPLAVGKSDVAIERIGGRSASRRELIGGAVLFAGAIAAQGPVFAAVPRIRHSATSTLGKAALQSYRKGVAAMRARSASTGPLQPTSWSYQALIHGIVARRPKGVLY